MTIGPPTGNRRLPQGSPTTRREPEEIGTIITRWLRKNRVAERVNGEGIYQTWKEIVGEEIASQTRVVKYAGGILTVEVASAPLLLELSGYYREGILESIRAEPRFAGIQDIRFRAGTVPVFPPAVSSPSGPPEGAVASSPSPEGASFSSYMRAGDSDTIEDLKKERRIGRRSEEHGEAGESGGSVPGTRDGR